MCVSAFHFITSNQLKWILWKKRKLSCVFTHWITTTLFTCDLRSCDLRSCVRTYCGISPSDQVYGYWVTLVTVTYCYIITKLTLGLFLKRSFLAVNVPIYYTNSLFTWFSFVNFLSCFSLFSGKIQITILSLDAFAVCFVIVASFRPLSSIFNGFFVSNGYVSSHLLRLS